MKRYLHLLAAAALGVAALPASAAEPVILTTPIGFQVLDISPNGKWATGVYADYNNATFAFRWNLLTGSIDMLSSAEESIGWCVSDNGVVSGNFADTQALPNHAPTQMPGYWADGQWVHLEMPDGSLTDGLGYGITPDGHYMSGSMDVNGKYKSFIWKDGKIHRELEHSDHSMAFCIAPDGQSAAGWAQQHNRTAVYWAADGQKVFFEDSPTHSQTPFNAGLAFSPDGKKLLYWGGWSAETDDADTNSLYCVYDIETGTKTDIPCSIDSDVMFYDITDQGTLVGNESGHGCVYTDGKIITVEEYLTKRGVDLSKFDGFYSGSDYTDSGYPIMRVQGISADENVLALFYYGPTGDYQSMVIRIGQSGIALPVEDLQARQLEGLSTVELTWKQPVQSVNGGYQVYRDDQLVSGALPLRVNNFYDNKAVDGESYVYEVVTLDADGNPLAEKRQATIALKANELPAPIALSARQKGVNDAFLFWEQPYSNMVHKHYNMPGKSIDPFSVYENVDMEAAICYPKHEMARYASGFSIREVSFVPMAEHKAWQVNLYSRSEEGTLTLLHSELVDDSKLVYRQRNSITLSEPVAIPADADLIIAIEVNVNANNSSVLGAQTDRVTPGYSDLLRQASQPEFFSAFENSSETAYTITTMSWAIDLGLLANDAQPSELKHFQIYLDGEAVKTTEANAEILSSLADGAHTVAVEAVYADGNKSPMLEAQVDIAAEPVPVEDITVHCADKEATAVTASWSAPKNEDATWIAYTTQQTSNQGIKGTSSNNYGMVVAADYADLLLKGYEGYRIKSVKFYPLADALFTAIIYKDGVQVAAQELDFAVLNQWNEVKLNDEVVIEAGSTYRVAIDCYDPEPDTPLIAVDNYVSFPLKSDIFSIDNGETWDYLSTSTGVSNNWMLGMTIVDPEAEELDVEGYDIYFDRSKQNSAILTETAYTHDFGSRDSNTHMVAVDVHYAGMEGTVKGNATYFTFLSADVEETLVSDIVLRKGDNFLQAEGEGVKSIALYAADGRLVARADGNTLRIPALAPGIYVASVAADGKTVTRKFNIQH